MPQNMKNVISPIDPLQAFGVGGRELHFIATFVVKNSRWNS